MSGPCDYCQRQEEHWPYHHLHDCDMVDEGCECWCLTLGVEGKIRV